MAFILAVTSKQLFVQGGSIILLRNNDINDVTLNYESKYAVQVKTKCETIKFLKIATTC